MIAVAGAAAVGCSGGEEAATTVTSTLTTSEARTVTDAPVSQAETGGAGRTDASGDALRFRGNGDRRLPPFRVKRGGTVLSWTNNDEVFSLFSPEGTVVDSVARQGEAFLQGGVHTLDVVASGRWAIAIPGARRLR